MPIPTSISTRLEYQHKSLIDIIEGLSDEQIRLPVIPGKWSVFENIVHLATYQHVFIWRIQQILSEENPEFDRYTADADPYFHDNCTKSTREIMQMLISVRREIIDKVHSMNDDQVARSGVHPVFGKMTIVQWLNFFVLHEAHHLFTIFKLTPAIKNR